MAKKTTKEIIFIDDTGVSISRFHLSFIYTLILWPIVFLACFVTQQEWFVGSDGFLFSFSSASGSSTNSSNLKTKNTLLSDEGRINIFWVSLLLALASGLVIYLLLYYL